MNQRTISHLSSFWLVLVLAFGLSSAFTVIPKPFRNNYVRIVNNLNNKLLYYHCQSRDNVIGTTLFYCKFWQDKFHAAFDVFTSNEKFQKECGGDHCIWIAQEDGLYLYELKKQTSVKMHDWEINMNVTNHV
ncbi:s-protein like protein 1 [Quercus suber]|uniref:S-protein homolog n=1 Tax=Quercus suber TaxID=58331 RepID=A0AAW0K1G9_QUESU